MEFVIGIKGKDFVLIGADQSAMRSVIVYQQELDKIHPIGKKTALAGSDLIHLEYLKLGWRKRYYFVKFSVW